MQEKHLYEYAVIRVVPQVEREEFMNVGVIMYCSSKRFLQTLFEIDTPKLQAFSAKINIDELRQRLEALKKVSEASPGSGPIGKLSIASRFRWLAASRSTVIQISPVHPGMCVEPNETIEKIFRQQVL